MIVESAICFSACIHGSACPTTLSDLLACSGVVCVGRRGRRTNAARQETGGLLMSLGRWLTP